MNIGELITVVATITEEDIIMGGITIMEDITTMGVIIMEDTIQADLL